MADISGTYQIHGRSDYSALEIVSVSGSGALDASLIDPQSDKVTIHGTYDAATNKIDFNDATFPGNVLFTTFFTGFAIIDGTGAVVALAGTWRELSLTFDVSRRVVAHIHHDNGLWYADNHYPLIQ